MSKKILVVDDSALMRKVLSDIIATDERFTLADFAKNGLEAFDMIVTNPSAYDLVILDINMPKMNGIQLMEALNDKKIKTRILIISAIAKEGAAETIRCLELGAIDFITKPDSFVETKSHAFQEKCLRFMCNCLGMENGSEKAPARSASSTISASRPEFNKTSGTAADTTSGPMSYTLTTSYIKRPHIKVAANAKKLVCIASSTGGPKALQQVIPKLPANLNAPVVLVQHMPEGFTATLAQRLDEMSKIKVKEAQDGEILKKGTVYIAKGGYQMKIVKSGNEYSIKLTTEPARNGLRPCADIMFESLVTADYDEFTCAVLTGMGSDGTRGIGTLNDAKKNLYVIGQDEESCTVYGMPRMVFEAGLTNEVPKLASLADAITANVGTV